MPDLPLPSDPELDELLLNACAARLGLSHGSPPLAVQQGRCAAMKSALGKMQDPDTGKGLSLHSQGVFASFDPDERGLIEVLYLDKDVQPMTAFVKGTELAYLVEGW